MNKILKTIEVKQKLREQELLAVDTNKPLLTNEPKRAPHLVDPFF